MSASPEIFRALGALVEAPCPEHAAISDALELGAPPTAADHTEAFVFSLYPYASVYLGAEGMIGGEARDRIAGFFRAIGAPVPVEPDHLTVLLASYAGLAERAARTENPIRRAALASARKAFFWEHLASFLPAYASAMGLLGVPFYARWAEVLGVTMRAESDALGPPDRLPIHFAETLPFCLEPSASAREVLVSLLSPVRTGMILLRRDLLCAARELEIGSRAGERRYVLSSLLSQDASGVLAWLSRHARRWEARHTTEPRSCVAAEWAARARATSEILSVQAAPAGGAQDARGDL